MLTRIYFLVGFFRFSSLSEDGTVMMNSMIQEDIFQWVETLKVLWLSWTCPISILTAAEEFAYMEGVCVSEMTLVSTQDAWLAGEKHSCCQCYNVPLSIILRNSMYCTISCFDWKQIWMSNYMCKQQMWETLVSPLPTLIMKKQLKQFSQLCVTKK